MASGVTNNEQRAETGRVVPDDIQTVLRERLKMIRLSRRKHISGMVFPHTSTYRNFELHDISTMQLRHLYFVAEHWGLDFFDLVNALFNAEGAETLVQTRSENAHKMLRLFEVLDEEDQEVAIRQLDALIVGREKRAALVRESVPVLSERRRVRDMGLR